MLRRLATALTAVSLASPAALGQPASARPSAQDQAALQQVCAGDFLKFCTGIDPASPAVEACFERNAAQLSAPCGQAIQTYRQRARAN